MVGTDGEGLRRLSYYAACSGGGRGTGRRHRGGGRPAGRSSFVRRHLHLVLLLLLRGAMLGLSWAERPIPALLDMLRFFATDRLDSWEPLAPPAWSVSAGRNGNELDHV